jgi:hypothetical protein
MSQWKVNILTSIVTLLICVIIFIIWVSSGSFKPAWEISKKELSTITIAQNYYSDNNYVKIPVTDSDFGIKCGSVEIRLGDEIDPNDYIIKERVVEDGIVRYYLQAQSKRYELIAVGVDGTYKVHKIRTTNIGVSGLRGQTISQDFKDVNSLFNDSLKNKSKVKLYNTSETRLMQMQFRSGILCEISLEYIG